MKSMVFEESNIQRAHTLEFFGTKNCANARYEWHGWHSRDLQMMSGVAIEF